MSVLLQPVATCSYAFVAHSHDPVTGSKDAVVVEAVPGMGEALVAAHPGRALRASIDRATGAATVVALPAKRGAVRAVGVGLMARSDSNGEDLEGFAGAGLYESIQVGAADAADAADSRRGDGGALAEPWPIASEPLVWEGGAAEAVAEAAGRALLLAEKAFGGPQDVEGCIEWPSGKVTLVQARPQLE